MRIDILGANLSSNAYGRAYLLGQVLARRHRVRMIGPCFGPGIWPPGDDGTLEVLAFPGGRFPAFRRTMAEMAGAVDADLVIAVKPRPASLGTAVLARRRLGIPILLDIDDWDLAGVYGLGRLGALAREILRLRDPYSNLYLRLLTRGLTPDRPLHPGHERRRPDAVTVVSRALQRRFGGVILPHGRDTDVLDPARHDRAAGRARLGIADGRPLVLFLGTPRPHKGLEPLAEAVASLADLGAMLAIVGAPLGVAWCQGLAAAHPHAIRLFPPQPWSLLGPTLAAADAVALPQALLPFTEAQVPAKVYDAMAMARPIVASAVGDLPEILDQGAAGLLVPPGDMPALAAALRRLLTDRELAAGLGAAARRRAVERYSYAAMEQVLEGVFERLSLRRRQDTLDT